MSERYSSLFRLPENLYSEGAPVLIAAGALLKDNQTGNIIAQLKLKNIGEKHIKAVKVAISPMDSVNRPLGDTIVYDYLDLDIKRDKDFGQKNPIRLSDASTRAYAAQVVEVSFADNTVWSASGAPWEALSSQDSLSAAFQDAELVKQFQLEYGNRAIMQPKQDRDLWLCYCGAVNRRDETHCHICECDPNFDFEAISEKKNRRLAEEKAEAERKAAEERAAAERRAAEAAAAKAAAEAKAKKTKKTLAIVIPSVAVVAAVVLLLTLVVIPSKKYNDALALGDAGQYEQAIAAFDAMGGYKDSAAQSERLKTERENAVNYAVAETLLDAKDYDAAIVRFRALGDYRDSAQRALEVADLKLSLQYAEAEKLLSSNDYDAAIAVFRSLGNYRDSAERVSEVTELKLTALYAEALDYEEQGEYGTAVTAFRRVLNYSDSREHIANLVAKLQGCISVSPYDGLDGILGLHYDGTVSYLGWWNDPAKKQYMNGSFSTWNDIVSVSCGFFDLGLRSDGTVAIVGGNWQEARSRISSWRNLISVSCHGTHAVGLRNDGTVIGETIDSKASDCINVSKWNNIAAVSAGFGFTVGLKTDGTVVSTPSPSDIYGKSYSINCSAWRDIVAISAGYHHVLGLRADGTVVATGKNEQGECDVSNWTDIVAISTENCVSMGLKADGTVVVKGTDYWQKNTFDVSSWHDIVAISASGECLAGLQANGKVVLAFADKPDAEISLVSNWTDIGRKG